MPNKQIALQRDLFLAKRKKYLAPVNPDSISGCYRWEALVRILHSNQQENVTKKHVEK